jgi:hypothetical protein
LNGAPLTLPPQISRALYPADRVLTGADRHLGETDWRARYDQLRRGGDLPVDPASDSVEAEVS